MNLTATTERSERIRHPNGSEYIQVTFRVAKQQALGLRVVAVVEGLRLQARVNEALKQDLEFTLDLVEVSEQDYAARLLDLKMLRETPRVLVEVTTDFDEARINV